MNAPLVTVLIPAYNAAETIERALESALSQSYEPKEVVVVNDASPDDTATIVERYADRNVRLVNLEKNVGECGAMNAGIQAAAGAYIAFLDADDEWREGKLEKQLAILCQQPDLIFITSDGDFVKQDGEKVSTVYDGAIPVGGADAWKMLLENNFVAKPCVVAQRAALLACNGFDQTLRLGGDQDMWIRLAAMGPIAQIPESLVKIYLARTSLTQSNLRNELTFLLPMIEGHVKNLSDRLTSSERQKILVHRWYEVGRSLCEDGAWREGAKFLLRPVRAGYRVGISLHIIMTSSPPARWLKRLIGREQ